MQTLLEYISDGDKDTLYDEDQAKDTLYNVSYNDLTLEDCTNPPNQKRYSLLCNSYNYGKLKLTNFYKRQFSRVILQSLANSKDRYSIAVDDIDIHNGTVFDKLFKRFNYHLLYISKITIRFNRSLKNMYDFKDQ